MIFPQTPRFICMQCGALLELPPDSVNEVKKHTQLRCTSCGMISSNELQGLFKFMKFYNRLVAVGAAVPVGLKGYEIFDMESLFFYINNAVFTCEICHADFTLSMQRIKKISGEPAIFKCPKCGVLPVKNKDIKEFFLCLYWVLKLPSAIGHAGFQYDFFSPAGISVAAFQELLCRRGGVREKPEFEPP